MLVPWVNKTSAFEYDMHSLFSLCARGRNLGIRQVLHAWIIFISSLVMGDVEISLYQLLPD